MITALLILSVLQTPKGVDLFRSQQLTVQPTQKERIVPIIYPANKTNYEWQVEFSADNEHWGLCTYETDGTNIVVHSADKPFGFYRMRGISKLILPKQ